MPALSLFTAYDAEPFPWFSFSFSILHVIVPSLGRYTSSSLIIIAKHRQCHHANPLSTNCVYIVYIDIQLLLSSLSSSTSIHLSIYPCVQSPSLLRLFVSCSLSLLQIKCLFTVIGNNQINRVLHCNPRLQTFSAASQGRPP